MKIGLVGYFDLGNYGDELFLKVFRDVFPDCQLTILSDFKREPIVEPEIVDEQDCVIIGGGDLVIPYAFAHQYWHPSLLTKPVYVVGVGVPTWGGYSKEAVDDMSQFFQHENIRLITARDPKSRDWIVQHLNPNVPVRFYPDIAAALDYERKPLAERTLGIILRGHQSDDSLNVKRLLAKAVSFGYNVHNIVLSTGHTAQDDISAAHQIADFPFSSLIIRETIEDLTDEIAQCDLIVSQKFHGCVVALMMGIPCISLSGSDKFVSFLEFFDRDLFITQARDPNLRRYLMEPMYEVRPEDIRRIKGQAREGLLYVRNAILGGD